MRKMVTGCVLVFLLAGFTLPAYAQKGYSSGAYSEQVDERSYFQRASDWFTTLGKSREEKALIKVRRRTARKIANNKKKIAQKKREIEKKKRQFRKQLKRRQKKSAGGN